MWLSARCAPQKYDRFVRTLHGRHKTRAIQPSAAAARAPGGGGRNSVAWWSIDRPGGSRPRAQRPNHACCCAILSRSRTDRCLPGNGSTCSHCAALNMAAHAACPPDLASPTPSLPSQITSHRHAAVHKAPTPSHLLVGPFVRHDIYSRDAHAAPMIWSRAVNC